MKRVAFFFLVFIMCIFSFFPIYWLVNTSLLKEQDLFTYPPIFLSFGNLFLTYYNYLTTSPVLTWLRNSLFVSMISTTASTGLGIFGAYSISRFNFKGKTIVVFLILLTQMVPSVLLVIPIYVLFLGFKLNNTLLGLALVYTAMTVPIGLWFLKGFFDAIPIELEQAALIDGCTRTGTLFRIIVPLSAAGIIATATWSFIIAWDEYLISYTLLNSEGLWTISVGLSSYIGQYSAKWSDMMAGAVLATIPVAVLYLIFQRYIISGLTSGAIKA